MQMSLTQRDDPRRPLPAELGEVRPAAVPHVDRPEAVAVAEREFVNSFQRARERDLCDLGVLEGPVAVGAGAPVSDLLQALVQHDPSQTPAVVERGAADLPQAGRRDELLQAAVVEALLAERSEPAVLPERHPPQALAVLEGVVLYLHDGARDGDLPQSAAAEAPASDVGELAREAHLSVTSGSLWPFLPREGDASQAPAVGEGLLLEHPQRRGESHGPQPRVLEDGTRVVAERLQPIVQHH